MSARRERAAVAVAGALHLVALVLARGHIGERGVGTTSVVARSVAELEIDVASEPAIEAPERAVIATATIPAEPRSEPSLPRTESRTAPPTAASTSSAALEASPAGTWAFSALREAPPINLSLGASSGRPPPTDEHAPPRPENASEAGRRVFAELDARDVERGVGRGGPVASAIEEAVRTSERGMMGVALFDVTVDRAGAVKVDLVRARGDAGEWDGLRESIARLVADKTVRIPEGASGLAVEVEVEAKETFADGSSPKALGNRGGVTLGEVGTESVAMKAMPSVGVEHRGKVCSARASVGVHGGDLAAQTNFGVDPGGGGIGALPSLLTPFQIAGGCSPENIGVPSRRMVASHVVRETAL